MARNQGVAVRRRSSATLRTVQSPQMTKQGTKGDRPPPIGEHSNYDANGNVGTITDPNGVSTTFTYDARNRLLTSTTQSLVTQYGYDTHGNLAFTIPPEGNRIDYTYTLTDKLSQVTDTLGNKITYAYDVEGNRISENIYDPSNTLKKYLTFTHDTYNRLKRIINPDSTYTEYAYDDKGNRTSFRDPRTNTTGLIYDPLDRLVGVTRPLNSLIDYGYDTHNNNNYVIDPNDYTTQYSYDDFGGRYRVISPDTGLSSATYDNAGNTITQTDANGSVITLAYDALNRQSLIQFSDSTQNITYVYDTGTYGKGHLTGRTDKSGAYTFTYDGRGNLTQEQKTILGIQYTTGYSYNANDILSSLTYPSGRTVTYSRDAAGHISGISTNGTTLASSLTYAPFGGITGLTYGNGILLTRAFDNQYRLSSLAASSVLNFSYNYDPNGNITSIIDSVNPPGGPSDQAGTYSYVTGSNKLGAIAGSNPMSFAYDANGNTTTENTQTFAYDLLNRLITITDNGTQIASYTYNSLNQRVSKTTSSGTRIFHYDLQGHLIAETTSTGSTVVEYIYLGDEILAQIRSGSIYYYHNDHLGTPQVITNSSGSVVWKASYTPFGKAQTSVSTIENNIRFPGQYFDSETGLHYNWNRYYQPETGRYVTPDPIGLAGGVNPYIYTDANPINWTDRLGLEARRLRELALALSTRTDIDDVEKLALMMDFAKQDNPHTLEAVNDLADVLTGGVRTIRGYSPYYVGIRAFGSKGFKKQYCDQGNQVRHFVGSLVAGYYRGIPIGSLMVYGNELRYRQPLTGSDVELGVLGADMGANLNKIPNWGSAIRQRLHE
jgi:RHS repeat-associated protein